jgi:microcystin degradation protein MlrC
VPRVLTARFMHETNTFSRVKIDMALIRRCDFHLENEIPQAFCGTRSAGHSRDCDGAAAI